MLKHLTSGQYNSPLADGGALCIYVHTRCNNKKRRYVIAHDATAIMETKSLYLSSGPMLIHKYIRRFHFIHVDRYLFGQQPNIIHINIKYITRIYR